MGQMIDEEECEVCIPFDQEWIFTYGDLVTLLFCFFVLLFSMCVYETEKFKSVASSFKPLPAGTPFISEGRDSVVEDISKKVEESELGDDADVNVEDKGVVVSFKASTFFEEESTDLNVDLNSNYMDGLVKYAVLLQEIAGLDVVTDGEWRRQAYTHVINDLCNGFIQDPRPGIRFGLIVTEPISTKNPGLLANDARFLVNNSNRLTKISVPSPYICLLYTSDAADE